MKSKRLFQMIGIGASAVLIPSLAAQAAIPPEPQQETFPDEFSVLDYWSPTWGTFPLVDWSSEDVDGATDSGSLKMTGDYFTTADDGWEQMVITRSFETPIIGSEHTSISVMVKVTEDSTPNLDGNFGYFEFKRTNGSTFGGVNLTEQDWTEVVFELSATEGDITGLIVQCGSSTFQGNVSVLMDNLTFVPRNSQPGEAPPLSLSRIQSSGGLRLTASAFGQAYQRQNIVFVPSEDWFNGIYWGDTVDPMTYSITWADFPDRNNHAGFQGHLMLTVDGGGSVSPDWNDPNVILLEFQYANWPGPDGEAGTDDDAMRARVRFLHKIYEDQGNAMLYRTDPANGPVGFLGEIFSDDMNGTWSLTFNDLFSAEITAPDGNSVSIALPQESGEVFDGSQSLFGIGALVGVQPNSEAHIGQFATLINFSINKGSSEFVNDDFTAAELNPDQWIVRAQDPTGIFLTPDDLSWALSWPLPDDGFLPVMKSELNGIWSPTPPARQIGNSRQVLIRSSELPSVEQGFFGLQPVD